MIPFSASTLAIELLDTKIPVPLKKAYNGRYQAPDTCIKNTEQYIKKRQGIGINEGPVSAYADKINSHNILPMQLLALCYSQVEDYQQSYLLLSKLLRQQKFSNDKIRTLDLLATAVPESIRPDFNNQRLINIFNSSLTKIVQHPFSNSPNLEMKLLLTITELSLENDQYRNASTALAAAKNVLKRDTSYKLHGWLDYYYGIYYAKINQQQLAIANLFSANKLAEKHNLIQLSGETKKSIASLYQKKHLLNRAIDFASQRVELYINTKNNIKLADSLIQLAILKEQNKDKNQSLIYLFNALELIQNKKHSPLLAQTYLELGRTYSRYVIDKNHIKERSLAQKYLQNARFHFKKLKDLPYQIESLLLLAQLNIINEEPALAILQLEKVLRLSGNNYPKLRVRAFNMLASSYEVTGNHQQAIMHFKNFHALQKHIKERLFSLQQLQINEQLELIERTQQQWQLEIKNDELTSANIRFKTFFYGLIILLIIAVFSLYYTLIRNRKLTDSETTSQRQLNYHPRTKIPSQQAQGNTFNYKYYDEPLYYALVNIPFLTHVNVFSGLFSGAKLEKDLGQELLTFFNGNSDVFQIRDNQILFISEQKKYKNTQDFAQKIEMFFTDFTNKYYLKNEISIGIVAFPFLNNVSRAITPTRMLNISSLALFGANQLLDEYQQSSWLELYAIDNLQPAFFDGDLWILAQKAIQKGIVKINCSHPKHQFYWPELDE